MKRIRELDGLRCFAILAVLCVHYRPAHQSMFYPMSLGWVGVDLFFVLSGFLITSNLVSLRVSQHPYREFYWRRLLRIVPPYYLVFCSIFAFQIVRHIALSIQEIATILLFISAFMDLHPLVHMFAVIAHHAPLYRQRELVDNHIFNSFTDGGTICWSLSFEEIFYLVWAPIVLRCTRRALLLITSGVILVSPVMRLLAHCPQSREAFFFPFRFDELAMGSLLALVFVAHQRGQISSRRLRAGLLAMGLATSIALIPLALECGILHQVEVRSALSFAAVGYSLLGLLFTALVGLAVLYKEGDAWWLSILRTRPLVYTGTISYMMYLIHVPVFGLMFVFLARFRGYQYSPGILFALVCTGITIAVSALSWKYFERPLLRFKTRKV